MNWKALLLVLSLAAPGIAHSNALTPNKSTFTVTPYYLYYRTQHVWDQKGRRQPNYNCFKRHELGARLRYDLTSCDTLEVWGAYDIIDEKLDGKTYGFTDFEFSWKRRLFGDSKKVFSIKTTAIAPFKSGYKPGLRYGQWGAQVSIQLNNSIRIFGKDSLIHNDLGYRWYQGFPSDQVRHRAIFRYPLNSFFSLRLGSCLDYGVFNGKSRLDQSLVWMNPNYRLWKAESALVCHIRQNSCLSLGYFQHLWGENVGCSGGVIATLTATF